MKTILYYTVTKCFDIESEKLNGTKYATIYKIENNVPRCICKPTMELTDNTENHIRKYLKNAGMDIDNIELVII